MGLRGTTLALLAGLLAVGLFAASPFLTDRMVGTGEAYNYSLSVADAVTQMRAGVFPPLAGQTRFASMGRIHPLRTAPYLHYLAYAIDVLDRRYLALWQLQTASLALSLVAAVFACYLGLRWATGCPRDTAFLLSGVYGLSPALLGAAYSFDLYMTVHVAVFVPLAAAACIRGCLRPSFSVDAWLAAVLAAAWLTHPPVALWLTAASVFVRVVAFLRSPTLRALANGACAVLLGACLASFVYVSTSSLAYPLSFFSGRERWYGVADEIMGGLRNAFPACVLPVSRGASQGGDLQFGYVPYALLLLTLAGMFRADWRRGAEKGPLRSAALGSAACAAILLVFVLPVPGITRLLWYSLPPGVLSLTSIWPFQRVYLVALPFALFAAAIVLPRAYSGWRMPRWAGYLAIALGTAWTIYQAKAYISRGLGDRWTMEATRAAYRPSNLDMTITSYAFVQTPPAFVNGVIDPQFEYRLLRGGAEEIASPLATALATAPVVDRGTVRLGAPSALTLKPGRRYLLRFSFRVPTLTGHIQISGPLLFRNYSLPSSGSSRAFGMLDGQRRAIPIWTDGDKPERVEVNFFVLPPAGAGGPSPALADYTLLEVDPSVLPIRLKGYLPMRLSVDSPELGCAVETPQRYLPGYEAKVNGKPVTVLSSPDQQVMVPVPIGHSEVELSYVGPRSARAAFWFCAASWAAFLVWRLTGSWTPERPFGAVVDAYGFVRRHRAGSAAALAATILLAFGALLLTRMLAYRAAVGPIEVRFKLPYGRIGQNQPLLATGHPGQGVVVFVSCLDLSHVRIGADVWGQLFQSEPIETDFSDEHELVVSDGALYPRDHPAVRALNPGEAGRLRGELDVELDGRTAIRATCDSYETTLAEIHVGMTRFGSLTIPRFQGEILGMRRLPIPRQVVLPWGRRLHMDVAFPRGREEQNEPLLAVTAGGRTQALYVTYLSDRRARLSTWSPDGAPAQSAEVVSGAARNHSLDFEIGSSSGQPQGLALLVSLDGKPLFGSPPDRPDYDPPLIASGVNFARVPGVQERFTGARMEVGVAAEGPLVPRMAKTTGPVHMIVSLPFDKFGRGEPLVTTGRTGAGDLVYVRYTDSTHIQVALDHWGGIEAVSAPIPVDYAAPHEIWVDMNSLNDPQGQVGPSPVTVMLDGRIVLSSAIVPYPSTRSEVTVAQNLIGGSNEDPSFSGTLYFVERLGSAAIPAPRS